MSSAVRTGQANGRRVGALRDLYTRPLYRTLHRSSGFPGELLFDTPAAQMDGLMSKERDVIYIPPVEYAQNSSGLFLYPELGVSSAGQSNSSRLYLRRNLQKITTMAVGAVMTTDVVLSRIVLGEKYDSEPAIVPALGSVDEMLVKADSALVTGDALLTIDSDLPFIDMVDEWTDMTELPFVHTLCVGRSETFDPALSTLLIASQNAGRSTLESVVNELAAETGHSADLLQNYLSRFSYGFDDLTKTALEEFFRMAFYYGMLGDIPEITIAE